VGKRVSCAPQKIAHSECIETQSDPEDRSMTRVAPMLMAMPPRQSIASILMSYLDM